MMKKIVNYLFAFVICILSVYSFSACDLASYKAADIQDLYKTTIENQINVDTASNEMFGDSYTIDITYDPIITEIVITSTSSVNEYNLYTLDNLYNTLFEAIFRYYEDWNENFFEAADSRLSNEDFSNLYAKLNSLNETLFDVADAKNSIQTSVVSKGIDEVSTFDITSYIAELNVLVEKSIDFVTCFRNLHISKIFTDESVSANTIARTIDDMLLSFAEYIYIDNIQPFTIQSGKNMVCDLSVLINAQISGNEYVILDYLDKLNVELTQPVIDALDNYNDVATIKKADIYVYYSNILRQNILTLRSVAVNIDYYKLSMYRYGRIEGGVNVYQTSISDLESTAFSFLCQVEDFINNYYIDALNAVLV